MADDRYLDFLNPEILLASGVAERPGWIILQIYTRIGQITAVRLWYFDFSRWRPSAILDLCATFLDHPGSIFGGLC